MHKGHWLALGGLLGAIFLSLTATSPAQSQKSPKSDGAGTFAQKLAKSAQMTEDNANRFLQALGPVVRDELAAGKTITLQGLGTFRVVRIPDHKDMVVGGRDGGTPIVVPGVNNVEFLPAGDLSSAANSANATPAVVVPPFQYTPLPGQTPGQKMGRTRVPTIRIQ